MFENLSPLANCIIGGAAIWAAIVLVSLVVIVVCIHRAPYGYEDDGGFHVIFPANTSAAAGNERAPQ